jgi:Sec-independent protein secretion pathway component TatC
MSLAVTRFEEALVARVKVAFRPAMVVSFPAAFLVIDAQIDFGAFMDGRFKIVILDL